MNDYLPKTSYDEGGLVNPPEYSSPSTNFFDLGSPSKGYELPLFDWTNPNTYANPDPLAGLANYSLPGVPALTDYSNWGNPIGVDTTDWTQYITEPSLWDSISGGADKLGGLLGTAWDKLTAGSGSSGEGPSLLSQLGTLGVGGLSAYSNYDAYRTANELAKEKAQRDYELQQAQLGLTRDTNMLNQQQARVGAANDLSKTNALFDLIKQRQGVDLSSNLKPFTDQLAAQGWTPDYGLAPVTSTLGQFGTAPRPQLPPALANTQLPTAQTQAPNPDRAYAFARGGVMPGSGAAQGALGLLAGNTAGQDDSINARLSDGEYVMDADVVAALGDGNTAAGAAKLDQMRESIRRHKRSAPHSSIPPKAKSIEAYLKGGRK